MKIEKNITADKKLTAGELDAIRDLKRRQGKNAADKRKKKRAHDLALAIHEKLHLSFGQCVHLMLTGDNKAVNAAMQSANRNITKLNAAQTAILGQHAVLLSEFDEGTFTSLLNKTVEWAS